jgi:hypothetical protein
MPSVAKIWEWLARGIPATSNSHWGRATVKSPHAML